MGGVPNPEGQLPGDGPVSQAFFEGAPNSVIPAVLLSRELGFLRSWIRD